MRFPAYPMETKTGLSRPGSVTLRARMEYAGEVAGQAVRPWRCKRRVGNDKAVTSPASLDPRLMASASGKSATAHSAREPSGRRKSSTRLHSSPSGSS